MNFAVLIKTLSDELKTGASFGAALDSKIAQTSICLFDILRPFIDRLPTNIITMNVMPCQPAPESEGEPGDLFQYKSRSCAVDATIFGIMPTSAIVTSGVSRIPVVFHSV